MSTFARQPIGRTGRNGRDVRPHICMFVSNSGLRDPRVTREAEIAVAAGFRVTVVTSPRHDESQPVRQVQRGVTFLSPQIGSSRLWAWLRGLRGTGQHPPRRRPVDADVISRASSRAY